MGKFGKSNMYDMQLWAICSNMLIISPNHILESRTLSGMVAISGTSCL